MFDRRESHLNQPKLKLETSYSTTDTTVQVGLSQSSFNSFLRLDLVGFCMLQNWLMSSHIHQDLRLMIQ